MASAFTVVYAERSTGLEEWRLAGELFPKKQNPTISIEAWGGACQEKSGREPEWGEGILGRGAPD